MQVKWIANLSRQTLHFYKHPAFHASVMPDIQLSENGILKLLKDLNPHKAAGPVELKPLVLKELREVIAPMLRVIFQRSIEAGRVPRDWNDANVCPLFKKGDKSTASNITKTRLFKYIENYTSKK